MYFLKTIVFDGQYRLPTRLLHIATKFISIKMNKIGRIGFLGGGRIAQAMSKGFIKAGLTKAEAIIASVHPADTASFESFKQIGVETVVENAPVVQKSDVIFVTVKPQVVSNVLSEIKPLSGGKLFLSVAMGCTIKTLQQNLDNNARVIRVMTNTPALVQSGCSVYVRGKNATDADADACCSLLKAIGTCEEVDEYLLDPITALSGSGPAYVFVIIEALADGAVRMGLPRDLAYRLASQTVLGAGQLVRDSKEHPGQLKDNVTSPAGSTAAGLKELELAGLRAALAGAVEAATIKCRETASS